MLIKSKTIAQNTESGDKNTLINKILNSTSLSKEIYHFFKLKDVINLDSINSLIKWKSVVGEINLEKFLKISLWPQMTLNLETFNINFYTKSYQQTSFLVKIGIKESDQCNFCNNARLNITLYMVMPHNKGILATSNSFAWRNLWNIYWIKYKKYSI